MKKGLVILGVLVGAFFLFGNKDEAPATAAQIGTPKVGFNLDGTVRQLTDAEAEAYLQNNIDLQSSVFNTVVTAKEHWFLYGHKENRKIFA